MASTPKARVAILIGIATNVAAALAPQFSRAIVAGSSPDWGRKADYPQKSDWYAHIETVRNDSVQSQSGLIAEAITALTAGTVVTVYVAANAAGFKDQEGKYVAHPTISDPDGWVQVGSIARALGVPIVAINA